MLKEKSITLKTFTLPAGHTCIGAKDCLSRADRQTGKITDGEDTIFRCFMASAEARSPSLRKLVWHNLELIKATMMNAWRYKKDVVTKLADLIHESLPESLT